MVYTNSIATMKWWDPHTKKVKYFSSTKFDKNKNKLGKGWSPGFELITGTNNSTLPIHGFTSICTVVCKNTIILWVFTTAYKHDPVSIIKLILTTFKNEQHP